MVRLFSRVAGETSVTFEPSHERALDAAMEQAQPDDVVAVTGSMFLAGALRGRWVPETRILERRSAELTA
jgi:hypothetical protein